MKKTILLLLTFTFVATACAAPRTSPNASDAVSGRGQEINAQEDLSNTQDGANNAQNDFNNTQDNANNAQENLNNTQDGANNANNTANTQDNADNNAEVFQYGAAEIFGIYIDDSYRDPADPESVNRLVYLCYSITAPERRSVSIDSRSASVTIRDTRQNTRRSANNNINNIYPSERIPGACVWLPDFYYSDFLNEIPAGHYVWFAETFLIPADMLSGNKIITFSKPGLPDFERLRVSTDSVTWCDNIEQLASLADPDGYAAELNRRAAADDGIAERVRERINGRAWTVQAGGIYYRVAFAAPEHFAFFSGESRDDLTVEEFNTDTLHKQENSGTYQITNGYILCQFPEDSNNQSIFIPYALEYDGPNETLSLDLYAAFDPDK